VLIEQIDHAGSEPLERRFRDSLDVLRPAVQTYIRSSAFKAEFGRDRNLLAKGRNRLAQQFLVCEGTIGFRSVKYCDASLKRCPYQGYRLLLFCCWTLA
jgi:hypothetical protein